MDVSPNILNKLDLFRKYRNFPGVSLVSLDFIIVEICVFKRI